MPWYTFPQIHKLQSRLSPCTFTTNIESVQLGQTRMKYTKTFLIKVNTKSCIHRYNNEQVRKLDQVAVHLPSTVHITLWPHNLYPLLQIYRYIISHRNCGWVNQDFCFHFIQVMVNNSSQQYDIFNKKKDKLNRTRAYFI